MKNRLFRSVFSLLLAILIIVGMSTVAFADSKIIVAEDKSIIFESGGSQTNDLFGSFKGIMPGDVLIEEITVENRNVEFNFIQTYLRAILNDENDNPINDDVLYQIQEDIRNNGPQTDTEYMFDFLSKLSMKVWNGSELIYESSPDELDGLSDNVYLGTLQQGETLLLKEELEVPIELDNEYMDRIGEVDWVFSYEGFEETSLTVQKIWKEDNVNHPESIKVNLLKDNIVEKSVELNKDNDWTYTWDGLDVDYEWTVEEIVPDGYIASYSTEGNITIITNALEDSKETEPTKKETIKPTTTKATTKPKTGESLNQMFLFGSIMLALAIGILFIRIRKGKIKKY